MQISVVLILSIQDKEIKVCHFAKYITQMVLTESNMKERFPAIKVVWWINPRSFTAGLVSATETILLSYKLNMISWYSFFKVMHELTSFHCPLALLKTHSSLFNLSSSGGSGDSKYFTSSSRACAAVVCENHHATLISWRQVDLRDTDVRKGALRSYKAHPYLSLVILKIAGFKKNILCNRRASLE